MKWDEHPFGQHLPSLHELTDASNECRHGCLPFDRKRPPECRCWNLSWKAPARVIRLPDKPVKKRPRRAA